MLVVCLVPLCIFMCFELADFWREFDFYYEEGDKFDKTSFIFDMKKCTIKNLCITFPIFVILLSVWLIIGC